MSNKTDINNTKVMLRKNIIKQNFIITLNSRIRHQKSDLCLKNTLLPGIREERTNMVVQKLFTHTYGNPTVFIKKDDKYYFVNNFKAPILEKDLKPLKSIAHQKALESGRTMYKEAESYEYKLRGLIKEENEDK